MEEDKTDKGTLLYDLTEDEDKDKPQEVKDMEKKYNCINDSQDSQEEEKEVKKPNKKKGDKEFNTNNLLLNRYWIELISKITFAISLIVYEMLAYDIIIALLNLFDNNIDLVKDLIITLFKDIGLKWFFIVNVSQHLSIGFFCLTNYSYVLKEKNKPLKFFISNIIKIIIFYFLTIFIMKNLINDYFFGTIIDEINKVDISSDSKSMIMEVINDCKKVALRYVGNLLGDYNNSLDKLLIGSLFIFLYSKPKFIKEKYILYFRLLSILPIAYIILSFIFRTLNNLGKINLSIYVYPIFVGPKVTIFGFFISSLLYIKFKAKKYKMFDEEDNIIPNVFAKVSSKIFSVFGFIELYIGLFHSQLTSYGIGKYFLIIICAPIMILYDYKRDYEIHIRPCKKRNIGSCINISVSIFLYGIVIIVGLVLFGFLIVVFQDYIRPFVQFIIDNFQLIIQVIDIFYLYLG